MTSETHVGELDSRFSSPDAAASSWAQAESQLANAGIYWLTTVRAGGSPHVTPLIGVWIDGSFFFATGEDEQKARNLTGNRRVVVATGCNALNEGLDVIIEGEAATVSDDARLHSLADAYVAKYGDGWRFEVHDEGFYHRPGPPDRTGGWDPASQTDLPSRAEVFEVRPSKALGFGRGELFSQTRWRLSGAGGS